MLYDYLSRTRPMAISRAERSVLSQAREIILREFCERQGELCQLEDARNWASGIAEIEDIGVAASASIAARLIGASLQSLAMVDNSAQAAIDHIEAMIGVRD